MILFIFNSTIRQPVTAGCNLCRRGDHAFSDPGSERLGISFFAVYKSLFRQACIQITHAAHQKFVRKGLWQWLAPVGVKWSGHTSIKTGYVINILENLLCIYRQETILPIQSYLKERLYFSE